MSGPARHFDLATTPIEEGTTLIEASAGTGKTYCLAGLVVRLLVERKVDAIGRILVVTFTNAAADELQTRIREAVRHARAVLTTPGSEPAEPYLAVLREKYGAAAAEPLREALLAFDDLTVATIHGFCKQVLESHAFESGLPFDPELLEDDQALLLTAAEDIWRRRVYPDERPAALLAALAAAMGWNPSTFLGDYREMHRHPDTRLLPEPLPVAAALAGFEKLRQAIAPHFAPGPLRLALSRLRFKDPGATSAARLASLVDEATAFFAGELAALPALGELRHSVLVRAIEGGSRQALDQLEFAADCDDLFAAIATVEHALRAELLAELDRRLAEIKQRDAVFAFDDLLRRLRATLADKVLGDRLADAVRRRFGVALIDEFQDTDLVQYEIFRRLFRGLPLYLIGDPKQAIYRFRGADVFAYLSAKTPRSGPIPWPTTGAAKPAWCGRFPPSSAAAASLRVPADRFPGGRRGGRHRRSAARRRRRPGAHLALARPRGKRRPGDGRRARVARPRGGGPAGRRPRAGARRGKGGRSKPATSRCWCAPTARRWRCRRRCASAGCRRSWRGPATSSTARRWPSSSGWSPRSSIPATPASCAPPRRPDFRRRRRRPLAAGAGRSPLAGTGGDFRGAARALAALRFHGGDAGPAGLPRGTPAPPGAARRRAAADQLATRGRDGPPGDPRTPAAAHRGGRLAGRRAGPRPPRPRHQRAAARKRRAGGQDRHRAQSKGLEYEVVLCPFLWRTQRADGVPVLAHVAGGERVVYDFGSPELGRHQLLAEAERLSEDARLLYVALTRARHRCHVLWGRLGQRRRAAATALAYLLHAAQTPLELGTDAVLQAGAGVHGLFDEVEGRAELWLADPLSLSLPPPSNGWCARRRRRWRSARWRTTRSRRWPRRPQAAARSRRRGCPASWPPGSSRGGSPASRASRAAARPPRRGRRAPGSILAAAARAGRPTGLFAFARGTRAGSALHEILEETRLRGPRRPGRRRPGAPHLWRHGIAEAAQHDGGESYDPAAAVLAMLERLAACGLPARPGDPRPPVPPLPRGRGKGEIRLVEGLRPLRLPRGFEPCGPRNREPEGRSPSEIGWVLPLSRLRERGQGGEGSLSPLSPWPRWTARRW